MSDTNVHRLVGNLLVGTSHFFVDTTTNRVGVNTSTPSAALDVASGDLKVGSGITLASGGTITATAFDGDGSLLQNINSDSGSWVNGASSNVHLATSTDKVGIGVEDPQTSLHVAGDGQTSTGGIIRAQLDDPGGAPYESNAFTMRMGGYSHSIRMDLNTLRLNAYGNAGTYGAMQFVVGDGTGSGNGQVTAMTIGTGGQVGIGMVSPQDKLHTDIIRIGDWNGGGNGFRFSMDTNASLRIQYMSGQTVHSNIMSLKYDTGNVGIGVASPDNKLEVRGNIQASESDTNHGMLLESGGTIRRDYGSNGAGIHFTANGIRPTNYQGSYSNGGIDLGQSNYRWNNVYTETLNAVRDGVVADFTPSSSGSYTLMNFHSRVNNGSDRGFILVQDESANSPGSSSEDLRMTIGVYNDFRQSGDHSDELWLQGGGRLCFNVGSWDSELNSIIGTPGSGTSHGGLSYEWRVGNSKTMQMNKDGLLTLGPGGSSSYANFRKDGTWWRNYSSTNGAGIHLTGGAVMPADYNGNWPYSPTLGTSTYRWGQIYSTSSSISTSDRTTKQDINEMTESEKKVAAKMVNLFRTYRVKDAVEEKGEKARVHSGVVAQDLIEAFQGEGLDAHRYGLFCYDDVWMVDGKNELFETVYMKNGDRNFVDENGVQREYTADDEGVEEVKEGTGIFADKDTPGAVATPGLYSIRYEELLCFVVGGVLKDFQTTEAELKIAKADIETTKADLETTKADLQAVIEQNKKLEARLAFLESALIS